MMNHHQTPRRNQRKADDVLLHAEAILFVAAEPVDYATLAWALLLDAALMPSVVRDLRARWSGRGIRLQELAGTAQLVSAPEAGLTLQRFWAQRNRVACLPPRSKCWQLSRIGNR